MRGPYSGGIRGRVVLPQFFLVLFRPTLLPPVESTSVHVVFGLYAERSNGPLLSLLNAFGIHSPDFCEFLSVHN